MGSPPAVIPSRAAGRVLVVAGFVEQKRRQHASVQQSTEHSGLHG
jgi:hypothetical protein